MDTQSPPKRMTRARAAAKTNAAGPKTTKITTAALKAKATARSAGLQAKPEESHEEEDCNVEAAPEPTRATRGRAKRAVAAQEEEEVEEAPKKITRGRAKKEQAEPVKLQPTRTTRGRAKKVDLAEEEPEVEKQAPEPAKRVARTRAGAAPAKPGPKKQVTFQEPGKENVLPTEITKDKDEATTGLRARPVRKATAPTRASRARAKPVVEEKSSPLSPKKPTQVAKASPVSEDELATNEKTPMKPLMRSPAKQLGSSFQSAKKLDLTNAAHNALTSATQNLSSSMMASPARRPPQLSFKDGMKDTPQRIVFGDSSLRSPFKPSLQALVRDQSSPFKLSLQSPARRPPSPVKISESGSPNRGNGNPNPFIHGTPKATPFKISRFTPRAAPMSGIRPGSMLPPSQPAKIPEGDITEDDTNVAEKIKPLSFSGRLSSIVPRDTDLETTVESVEAITEETRTKEFLSIGPAELVEEDFVGHRSTTTTPPCSPPTNDNFLVARDANESPFDDSESEDELASESPKYAQFKQAFDAFATPTPANLHKTPKNNKRASLFARNDQQLGLTPLAKQLSDWHASTPDLPKSRVSDLRKSLAGTPAPIASNIEEPSPTKSTFFEDEMSITKDTEEPVEDDADAQFLIDEIGFNPPEVIQEDLDLMREADELAMIADSVGLDELIDLEEQLNLTLEDEVNSLCLVSSEEVVREEVVNEFEVTLVAETELALSNEVDDLLAFENAMVVEQVESLDVAPEIEADVSEASQDYGDENDLQIDPILLAASAQITSNATPKRILTERVFHTVSKVPLKAAAEDSPVLSPAKRSASVSRLPAQRPNGLSRNNTVISYSPTKSKRTAAVDASLEDVQSTPGKQNSSWSSAGTPARTPRRDIDNTLLKGAVVFVDVHTVEGEDASSLFIELLTQMGARCVKTWPWSGEDNSKIGITHVVYKDGGKKTLEKVRDTAGVVSCVGVGWVLSCERENKWVDEVKYAVDTAIVPRGGGRRRKSMEPRALANINGSLVSSTPSRPLAKEATETPLTSRSRRRESVQWQWERSPASQEGEEANEETMILTPVPATPAPEALFPSDDYTPFEPETPGNQTPYYLHNERLVQQTAPPKRTDAQGLGSGILSQKKDESVMMRLMAARRKSLQWAPKVGSPLARGNNWAL